MFKYCCLFILQILLFIGCYANKKVPEWVNALNKSDYKMVIADKYPYTNCQIDSVPTEIMKIKTEIEKSLSSVDNSELANKLVRNFFSDETENCNFKYTNIATSKDHIIIRFLSAFKTPGTYAGYSLEFALRNNKIENIYLFKVPNY
ncbi:MAG: hypothetical protein PHE49_06005 [bacterium]|nr:hypothetical protein [bacterium]